MRQYERNGVTIDQCGECRGVFLDRGELEHLLDAESRFYGQGNQAAAPPPAAPPGPQGPYPDAWAAPQRRYGYGSPGSPDSPSYRGHPGQYGRKRRSFLSELFD